MRGSIGVVGLEPAPRWHPEGIVLYGMWHGILEAFPDVEFRLVGLRWLG